MNRRYYILEMWQAGNIHTGPHSIRKVAEQPKEGFYKYEDAEKWLGENIDKVCQLWETYIIQMVYSKQQ